MTRGNAATADVAIVGGGPAGAILATSLARRGRDVVVLERAPTWRWRAGGVFSSPAAAAALERVGVPPATIAVATRRIPAMRVETASGATFRLTYGDDGSLAGAAVAFDRSALDPALLELARGAGARVITGAAVRDGGDGRLVSTDGTPLDARIIVGADGIRSVVARTVGVAIRGRRGARTGITFHVRDPEPATTRDARMITFRDGYIGLAPVPGGRVNVGVVLGGSWAAALRGQGAEHLVRGILRLIPAAADDPVDWRRPERCDSVEGAAPVGHAVRRRHGRTPDGAAWLLVGDAAGFRDPFTGEGLHRAIVSAELAAGAIERNLEGDGGALAGYDRAMGRRFMTKDIVSGVVLGFLALPPLFGYAARRLAARRAVRETMGLVMGDLVPARRALDPRFLADLLRP